ncbi:YeeE/YedE family protein [Chryseobacterium sp. NFX27]|uniref:YeeE/YedE family protein n=1 Tax=Chryseobacterium sp. NFX27 TaxID=2819618 RepID=UPI003CF94A7A
MTLYAKAKFSINKMSMIEIIKQPWPWYIAGPLIGLTVPALLIAGNKSFGISSSLRHICAACIPANISFFNYNWKNEIWNLMFVLGIFLGGIIAAHLMMDTKEIMMNPTLKTELTGYGITDYSNLVPKELMSFESLLTLRGFIIMVGGGILVGFGTRYAGGCTSGHAIMGLSNLQWPSLIATVSFMIGGLLMANIVLPFILSL